MHTYRFTFSKVFRMLQHLVLLLVLIDPLGSFLFAEGQEFGGYVCIGDQYVAETACVSLVEI